MYVMSNPRMHWSLHAHGSADALSALGNDMAAHPQALFETAVATAVDATTMTYYGKATLTRGEQVNAILKLSSAHPQLTLLTLTPTTSIGATVTLTSYRDGAEQGASRSQRYSALDGTAACWLPAGGTHLYLLATNKPTVKIGATGAAIAGTLSDAIQQVGDRTSLDVATHYRPGWRWPTGLPESINAHPDLQVNAEPAGGSRHPANYPGYSIRLTVTAYLNALLASYQQHPRGRASYRAPSLGTLLEACDDARATTNALLHCAFLAATSTRPTPDEHTALNDMAALTPTGGRRAAVTAVAAVTGRGLPRAAVEHVNSIHAACAALSPSPHRP